MGIRGLFFALAALIGGTHLWAQATQVSQIAGTVQDASGSAVPDAQVAITNTDTGIVRTAPTAADGAYIISNLPPGPYRLAVTKSGFAAYLQSGIVLQVNSNPQVNRRRLENARIVSAKGQASGILIPVKLPQQSRKVRTR